MKLHALAAGAFMACLMAVPASGRADGWLPEGNGAPGQFWAAASADLARPVDRSEALAELREFYRREEQVLADFRAIGDVRVYEPQATGRLWALHLAMGRREQALGLEPEDWGLPSGTVAVDPADYPRAQSVAGALERAPVPVGALRGLPVFLAPMRSPWTEARAVSYRTPWMDESVLLFSGADPDAVLHEIGHVLERQVLDGLPALAGYLRERAVGRPAGGTAWADKASENFAEDFRTLAGGAHHRGNWGAPDTAERSKLQALVSAGRPPVAAPDFALSDGLALRRWQPLTGLSFATDQGQVTLLAAAGAPAFEAELCRGSRCATFQGRAPFALTVPEPGAYTLTLSVGQQVWLDAEVSRVAYPAATHAAAAPHPVAPHPVAGAPTPAPTPAPTAAELLRLMADRDGWGAFPLPLDAGILGNGWDQDPAGRLLRWARLTGRVDPLFAWRYRPGDRIPMALTAAAQ